MPYGVAIAPDGSIYVSDSGNNRILKFNKAGKPLETWDQAGSGDGEFKSLGFGGLAVDADGDVFVVDNGNHRIQKFDSEGNYLTQWGSEGTDDGQFVRAIGIAVDGDGNVYVTDDGNPYVQKFDNNGQFLMKWGGQGKGNGQFNHATGIAVDAQRNVFVADYNNQRVQKFDQQGEFITAWTMASDLNSTGTPEGIAWITKDMSTSLIINLAACRCSTMTANNSWSLAHMAWKLGNSGSRLGLRLMPRATPTWSARRTTTYRYLDCPPSRSRHMPCSSLFTCPHRVSLVKFTYLLL